MKVDPGLAPHCEGRGLHSLRLSDAGGLTQFGAYRDRLDPGAWSSLRHWHSAEDEFLLILSGTPLLHDDAGETALAPGDALCFRHGEPDGHHLFNPGATPCEWLMVGSRAACDICTYTDDHRRLINSDTHWQIVMEDGQVLKGGTLPSELLNLRPAWGRAYDGTPMPRVLRKGSVASESVPTSAPAPYDQLGDYFAEPLSDAGGLTQFGAFTETLMPGSRSSHRHWHMAEDEFLYVLTGHPTLVEDTEQQLSPGDCAAWRAGVPVGHCLENRTDTPVTYFVAGSRLAEDEVTYPDIDLHYSRKGGQRWLMRKDGTPYPGWPKETNR